MGLEEYTKDKGKGIDGKILALSDKVLKEFIGVLENHLYDRTWCIKNGVDYVNPFGETYRRAKERAYESFIEGKI